MTKASRKKVLVGGWFCADVFSGLVNNDSVSHWSWCIKVGSWLDVQLCQQRVQPEGPLVASCTCIGRVGRQPEEPLLVARVPIYGK